MSMIKAAIAKLFPRKRTRNLLPVTKTFDTYFEAILPAHIAWNRVIIDPGGSSHT